MPWVAKRPGGARFQAIYRDPAGRKRSAGTFASEREARHAARRAESSVESGSWFDRTAGKATFRDYVEEVWWPSRHLELSTKQSYRSYLNKHFLPFFGDLPMAKILPSTVQGWVTQAAADGLSARSITKYHVMLHSIFKRAVRDRIIAFNPCTEIELPKVVTRKMPTLTPEEFDQLLSAIPDRWTPLVLTAIESGLRWGELIALRPRHIDFLQGGVRVIAVPARIALCGWEHAGSRRTSDCGTRCTCRPSQRSRPPREPAPTTTNAEHRATPTTMPCGR